MEAFLAAQPVNNPHAVQETESNAGDAGSIPGSGRSPGEGNSNPLQHSCLGNPMDRGAWQATVRGVARVGHDSATKQPTSQPRHDEELPLLVSTGELRPQSFLN